MSVQPFKNRRGTQTDIDTGTIQQFKTRIRGALIQPHDGSYDEVRKVYNAMHDRHPALIVQAAGVADVIATVEFCGKHDLLLAVRGGGHSAAGFGTCDGGLVLDLRRMRGIHIDPERRTARAEGGCTWGDFDHATHAFGLATPSGLVSTTGIAGLTLGGGIGYLSRRCGLSCDNLLSADVVTANGAFLTCDSEHHADLYWAIRGGGGNFGVVTSFKYQLHPIDDIYGGPTFYQIDGNVLRNYQRLIADTPEELGAIFGIVLAPPLPFVPEEWQGKPVMAVIACWSDSCADDEKVMKKLKGLGPVVAQALWRMPYPAINTLFDGLLPPGLCHYWKGNFAREINDKAVVVHLEHGPKVPTLESGTFLYPIDGACHRTPVNGTAIAYRNSNWAVVITAAWRNATDTDKNTQWVRNYYDALRPFSEEGGFVNFMSGDDQARVANNYSENYERLKEVKSRFDPDNLFCLNQNIAPG